MSYKTLPYLESLRTRIAAISSALQADTALSAPCNVAADLLDRMIVNHSVALHYQAECYAAIRGLLPAIEAELPATLSPDNSALDALRELGTICASGDTGAFSRFIQLCCEVQRALLACTTATAAALVKDLVRVESGYCRKLELAVAEQAAKAEAARNAPAARNVREINQAALLDFIRQSFPDEKDVTIADSAFISGGFSKFTVGITLANTQSLPKQIILRGDGAATYGGASVVDEYHLVKAVYDNGVSVPTPLALEATGKVFGSPFMLVERRSGKPMGHMFMLPGKFNKPLAEDIAIKLAAIHKVPLAAVGNNVDGANSPTSVKVIAWLDEAQRNWGPTNMPSPVFEAALHWLRRNAAINDKAPRTLVHGDYALHNLLFENDRVNTILDWEFAHIGNPAYDLGYFHYMATSLCAWEEFLQAYAKGGMPIPDEDQLDYNTLLATTRLGVMVCQSTAMFRSGAETGMAIAPTVASGYYEMTIKRISDMLEKVL